MGSDALIVVLSATTASMVTALARSGWPGPVLVVGSVAEAHQAMRAARPGETSEPAEGVEGPRPVLAAVPSSSLSPEDVPTRADRLGLVLDADRRVVVTDHGRSGLTPLEFGVLQALTDEPGRVWPFAELTRTVWGTSDVGDWAPVHAVVRRLRAKLEQVQAPVEVVAVRGVGFRLDAGPAPDTGQQDAPDAGRLAPPDARVS